ncbi:MAG: PepSY domain-containing protein [Gammaproteobacteria bacterium]|nr:PepSY domain-containing protein [Gammaproteobacteria bacterium]MBT8134363.1 PepSY domain-containing protein [Gammaproteobacteria bacterium]NNJ49489.1 PepSY domain-containing protein [Gammaproteobacteria bacterium]
MKNYIKTSTLVFTLAVTLFSSAVIPAETELSVTKQQAVKIAQQYYPGRVLAVKLKGNTYQVKTLNDRGEVRIIAVDAETGKILSEQ